MAALPPQVFVEDTVYKIGLRAMRLAKRVLRPISKTLSRDLELRVRPDSASVHIPYYWAVFIHDGHGPATPKKAKWLVWFKNKRLDPRIAGGYPRTPQDKKTLWDVFNTKQFNRAKRLNRMVFAKYSPGAPPKPFFSEGVMKAFAIGDAPEQIDRAFERWILQRLPKIKKRGTARARLR